MKVKRGDATLNPSTLFSIEASVPPDHIRTVDQILEWQSEEHRAMLDAAAKLFREELEECFKQFELELQEAMVKH